MPRKDACFLLFLSIKSINSIFQFPYYLPLNPLNSEVDIKLAPTRSSSSRPLCLLGLTMVLGLCPEEILGLETCCVDRLTDKEERVLIDMSYKCGNNFDLWWEHKLLNQNCCLHVIMGRFNLDYKFALLKLAFT